MCRMCLLLRVICLDVWFQVAGVIVVIDCNIVGHTPEADPGE